MNSGSPHSSFPNQACDGLLRVYIVEEYISMLSVYSLSYFHASVQKCLVLRIAFLVKFSQIEGSYFLFKQFGGTSRYD